MDKTKSQFQPVSPHSTQDKFDPQVVSVVVALLLVFVSIVLYFFKKRSSRKSILLVGLADSGKTTLFGQLAHNSFVSTVTSMKENDAQIITKNGKLLTLIDVPGFDRLRNQYWERFKSRSKAIIYVVDSITFMSNIHNVADLLYQYLCDEFVISNRIPLLVACTKQDQTRAKTSNAILTLLEIEFNTIRETRIGALDTTGGDENSRRILGNPNRPFQFRDIKNKISFVDCSASKDTPNLENVNDWINMNA